MKDEKLIERFVAVLKDLKKTHNNIKGKLQSKRQKKIMNQYTNRLHPLIDWIVSVVSITGLDLNLFVLEKQMRDFINTRKPNVVSEVIEGSELDLEEKVKLRDAWINRTVMYNKIIRAAGEIITQKIYNRSNEDFVEAFGCDRKKIESDITVGKNRVHLKIMSKINLNYHLTVLKKECQNIIKAQNKEYNLNYIEALSKALSKAKPKEIEGMLVLKFFNTIKYILQKYSQLIRTSNVKVLVRIYSYEDTGEGVYIGKSNFSYININFGVRYVDLFSLLQKREMFDINSEMYNTIVHEFTHAFDMHSRGTSKKIETAKMLFGDNFTRKEYAEAIIWDSLRSEGLACLSGEVLSNVHEIADGKRVAILVEISSLIWNFDKGLEGLIEAMQSEDFSKDLHTLHKSHNSLYSQGYIHSYGGFLAALILLYEFRQKSGLYATILVNFPSRVQADFSLLDGNTEDKVSSSILGGSGSFLKFVNEGELNLYLAVRPKNFGTLEQTFKKISMMNTKQFLKQVKKAAKFVDYDDDFLHLYKDI